MAWLLSRFGFAQLYVMLRDKPARRLASRVRPGDRVALMGAPSPRYVVLVHAIQRAGAVLVPVGPRLTMPEIRWLLASGTTGRPKGAVLTLGNFAWSAAASALRLGHLPEDRWLAAMPLHHVGGLSIVHRCATYATTVVLHRRFDAGRVAASLEKDRVSLVSLVPTMLRRVLDGAGPGAARGVPALRAALLGGDGATDALLREAAAAGFPLAPTYGLTEAASQVATTYPSRNPSRSSARGCRRPRPTSKVSNSERLPGPEVALTSGPGT